MTTILLCKTDSKHVKIVEKSLWVDAMRIPTYKNFNKTVQLKMLALFYIDTPFSKFIRADLNFLKNLEHWYCQKPKTISQKWFKCVCPSVSKKYGAFCAVSYLKSLPHFCYPKIPLVAPIVRWIFFTSPKMAGKFLAPHSNMYLKNFKHKSESQFTRFKDLPDCLLIIN